VRTEFARDVSHLPTHAFGHRSITWWGTLGFIAIESTVFMLGGMAYLYLAGLAETWPPGQLPPPDLFWGTLFTVVLVLSMVPNIRLKRAAEREDERASKINLVVLFVFGVALLGIRALEFAHLNVRWDENAYGSITWVMLGAHTLHLATDFGDSTVLTVLAFRYGLRGRKFADVSEDAIYWNFVLAAWLPNYVLIYLVPRWL
jgi:heme/copper-type cytochrome/quinol oxidase subunit 3